MNRKTIVQVRIAAGVALLTGLTGCGAASTDSGSAQSKLDAYCASHPADPSGTKPVTPDESLKGTVNIWGWYPGPADQVIPGFNKLYPNVKIVQSSFGLDEVAPKLRTALAAGTGAPDASMIEDRQSPVVGTEGLLDLTKCVEPYASAFPASKMSKVTAPSGEITAVPWEAGPVVLSYRRSIFDEYGIDPTKIKTWDDFIAAGKQLDEASRGTVKMTFSDTTAVVNSPFTRPTDLFQAFVQQRGGQFFEEDGSISITEGEEALALMKEIRDASIGVNDSASANAQIAAVKNKQVATLLTTPASVFFLQGDVPETEGDWGAIPLPAFEPGGNQDTNVGGTSIGITEQSKNPEAAWAFLRYWLLTVQGRIDSYKGGLLFENLYEPAAKDPFFQQPDPFYNGEVMPKLYAETAQDALPFTEGAKLPQLNQAFLDNLPDFYSGKISASDFIAELQKAGQ